MVDKIGSTAALRGSGEITVPVEGAPGALESWASSSWTLGSYLKNGTNSTFSCLFLLLINK